VNGTLLKEITQPVEETSIEDDLFDLDIRVATITGITHGQPMNSDASSECCTPDTCNDTCGNNYTCPWCDSNLSECSGGWLCPC